MNLYEIVGFVVLICAAIIIVLLFIRVSLNILIRKLIHDITELIYYIRNKKHIKLWIATNKHKKFLEDSIRSYCNNSYDKPDLYILEEKIPLHLLPMHIQDSTDIGVKFYDQIGSIVNELIEDNFDKIISYHQEAFKKHN